MIFEELLFAIGIMVVFVVLMYKMVIKKALNERNLMRLEQQREQLKIKQRELRLKGEVNDEKRTLNAMIETDEILQNEESEKNN